MSVEQGGGGKAVDADSRKVAGSIKEAIGKIAGDAASEREGAAEKAGEDLRYLPKVGR